METRDKRFRFFVIEDSRGDFLLVEEYLNEQFSLPSITRAATFKEAKGIFNTKEPDFFDCILLDLSLPDKSGEDLIEQVVQMGGDTPVVVLTGYTDLQFSVRSLSKGISDYLLKDELSPSFLHKSIIYSIKRNHFAEKIKESEKKYRTLFELSPEPMWLMDSATLEFLDVNQAAIDHYGYSKAEFLSMRAEEITTSENPANRSTVKNGITADSKASNGHYFNHRKKSGEIIKVEVEANEISYKNREAQLVLANDVTEKLKEEERSKLLESVVTNTKESVVILDTSSTAGHPRIVYVNKGFCEMTGYRVEEVHNRSLTFLTGEDTDENELEQLEKAIREKKSAEVELLNYKKEGEPFWVQMAVVPVEDKHGEYTHMVAIGREITDRKKSDEKLQVSLKEKEVLLAEIHHRIKNNLALVSGMLQMQVFDEDNEEVINKLNNSMLRVETMASIHQLLYESSSFSRLEFSKIINKLINATHDSFSLGKKIDIEIETEPFELNINQAVPCSLIINEAITNVYKHAFRNRGRGWIKAVLRREDDIVTFNLEDDGNGLPEGFDISDLSSLGTKIISALVKQLEGTFELTPRDEGGTIFKLQFSVKEDKGPGNSMD